MRIIQWIKDRKLLTVDSFDIGCLLEIFSSNANGAYARGSANASIGRLTGSGNRKMDLCEYAKFDATGLVELMQKRQVTSQEIVDLSIKAINAVNPQLNAIVELFCQRSKASYLENLPDGPLKGVPILKKDLAFDEAGHLNEMGSLLAQGMTADVTSMAFQRLRDAGVVSLGRTTTPEFGLSGTTESRLSGISRNPA